MPYANPKKDRNYKRENDNYGSLPEQKKNRAARNKARREALRAGTVAKGDGKDIDHAVPLSKGGSNAKTNRRVRSASANRSFKRNSDGSVK